MNLPEISIVVIGLNEGKNLHDTFSAVRAMDYPMEKLELIYVDTGSDDNSVGIAGEYTDKVFVETSHWPTSGLARNRGIIEARHAIIHFIDGDISISKNYLKKAVKKIMNSEADAVTGYFLERYPGKFFNRLMNIRRDDIVHKERYCESTNGGGTYIKEKLLSINGYDERILKGQESELGVRYRQKGFKILYIDEVQGLHNFGLDSVSDFIRFSLTYGRSGGYLLKMKEDLNDFIILSAQSIKKILISNILSLSVILISIVTIKWYLIPVYYFVRISFILFKAAVLKRRSPRQIIFSLTQYLFSFFTFLGIVKVLADPTFKPGRKEILSG